MLSVDEIIESKMTVNQKIKELEKLKEQCDKAIKKLEKDMVYCPECNEYYKPTAFQEEIKMEDRNVCTYWPLAEFDEPEYGTRRCRILYKTCPCGHITSKNLDYRF